VSWWQAIVLGLVQGLTEFLPVSSSGHLGVGQAILRRLDAAVWRADAPEMIAFDLAVHLGTLVPIVIVFRRELAGLGRGLVHRSRHAWRFVLLGALATAATFAMAAPVRRTVEDQFGRPLVISLCWLATAAVLIAAEKVPRPRRGLRRFTWPMALAIGATQAVATLPGISRSGSTIGVAMLLGLRRRWAARFSFLLAFPAILGASAGEAWRLGRELNYRPDWAMLGLGLAVAALTGWAALLWLLAAIRRAKLHYFGWYCAAVAALTTGLVLFGVLKP